MAGLLKASQHALAKVLLETGSSLEWLGKTIVADYSFYDHISQHRTFVGVPSLGNPVVDSTSTIDESATIVGNVEIGPKVTVASNAIISGPTTIGESAEIGAGAVLKAGVTVEPRATVATGSIVLPGTTVPSGEIWAGIPAAFLSKK